MAHYGPFVVTGDGYHDFGAPNQNAADIIWRVTDAPTNFVPVDTNTPAKVTRVGYVGYGTSTNGSADQSTWVAGEFRYVEFAYEDWNMPNTDNGLFQFLQWHLLPGYELTIDVYTY